MTSIDLKQAFFNVHVREEFQKYMMFQHGSRTFVFRGMANGLASAPHSFCKILRPVLRFLRAKLIRLMFYVDDSLIASRTMTEAVESTRTVMSVFRKCGFLLNIPKSTLCPAREIEFLGFDINTLTMVVSLTRRKRVAFLQIIKPILKKPRDPVMICRLSQVIGQVVSFVPASDAAAMQYRVLEHFKIKMLNKFNNKWNAKIILSPACIQQLLWWCDNIMTTKLQKSLTTPKVTVELFSDACNLSWGSTVGSRVAQAYFSVKQQLHINSKELLAVWLGVQAHREVLRNQHIKIFSDNSCMVGTLKQKGSRDPLRDQVTRQIYEFVWQMGSTLEVAFIAGVDNGTADCASRVIRCSEWSMVYGMVFGSWHFCLDPAPDPV